MTTINGLLFLGFPINESFSSALERNKPEYISLFIGSGDTYLNEVHFEGSRYLGKYIENETSLGQLELLEANIFSLLKKLVADYAYKSSHLFLFTLPPPTSS